MASPEKPASDSSPSAPPYRVCLIGSGGVGTIASLVLTKSGQAHVTAVLRSKYDYVSKHGWDIESVDHGSLKGWKPHRVVGSASEAAVEPRVDGVDEEKKVQYDFLVVCTKQLPDRNPVTALIEPAMTAGRTTVVLIQNGMGIEDEVLAKWPTNTVVSSVSHIGSGIEEPNKVVQVGKDVSKMGVHFGLSSVQGPSSEAGADAETTARHKANARTFVDMYLAGGAHVCELVDDIEAARWEKLLWNGTFNTVCALTRTDVGQIQRSKGRESLLLPMMWEIWNIAKAAGHPLPDTIVHWMAYRLPDEIKYRPSMLLDLENSRPMELEVILGNPLKVARRLGVATPVMDVVYNMLRVEAWKIDELSKE